MSNHDNITIIHLVFAILSLLILFIMSLVYWIIRLKKMFKKERHNIDIQLQQNTLEVNNLPA
jgi:hypothetical protein